MYNHVYEIDQILSIIKEAQNRKYSEQVLKYDLDRWLSDYNRRFDGYEYTDDDLEQSRDDAYDEGKEEGYDEGYEDGKKEGKDKARESFIQEVADEIIKLKRKLNNNPMSTIDIKNELTEMLIRLDENCDCPYSYEAE